RSGTVTHKNHRSSSRIFQLIKRTARDQRRHSGFHRRFAAVRKMHRAFPLDNIKSLVSVMAVHIVFVTRIRVVMDPGVKAFGVDKHFSLLDLMSLIDYIDDLDWHTPPFFLKVLSDF